MGMASEKAVVQEKQPRFIPTPEPGIYRGIPAEEYHRWDAISNSWISRIVNGSLKHFQWEREHPREPSKAMLHGTVLHALCLEPLEFAQRFAVEPKLDGRTKAGREARAQFEKLSEGKVVIPRAMYSECVPMAKALMAHAKSRELLADGEPEVSLVWEDQDTHVRCKARLDYLLPPLIGDVKTTRDGDPFKFSRACNDYGYHRQAAFYVDGAQLLDLDVSAFVFATVESKPPYDVVVYAADELMLIAGRMGYKRALYAYAKALETNQWPGRNEETVEPIGLPSYVLRDEGLDGRV